VPVVEQKVQAPVDRFHDIAHLLTLKPVIIHGFIRHIAVFLLDYAIVIFAVGTASGELDAVQVAPVFELVSGSAGGRRALSGSGPAAAPGLLPV
jgi:hypothetical protein